MALPTPAKLSSLTSSTLPLILERQRSLSLNLTPSTLTESTIFRNLALVSEGIQALELQRSGLRVGGGSAAAPEVYVDDERMKALRDGLGRLVGMVEEDSAGREKVQGIRKALAPPKPSQPSPSTSAPSSPRVSESSAPFPSTGLPRSSLRPAGDRPHRVDMYRDDDSSSGAAPSRDEPYRDDGEVMLQQREMMDDQDNRLALLSNSINRQHTLSLQIGDELEVHQGLLEETDQAIDRTQSRLNRATKRLNGFTEAAKQNGSAVTIVILIVLLAILILVFKT